jgi:4'-phosphopantetheinyl transferase-like protein/4'-phosphopantetheinyl transferase superfamily protein
MRIDDAKRVVTQLRAIRPTLGGLGYGLATRWDRDCAASDPAEYRLAARMTARRRTDFLVGRCALRHALADIGFARTGALTPAGGRNLPQLPAGVTASASHCRGIGVALAAPEVRFWSVGVDLELCHLPLADARLVLTEPERAWLVDGDTANPERRLLAAFAAKQAVYKALDPIVSVGALRRIHLMPVGRDFVGWAASRRDLRLHVSIQPVGEGVLAWALLRAFGPCGRGAAGR